VLVFGELELVAITRVTRIPTGVGSSVTLVGTMGTPGVIPDGTDEAGPVVTVTLRGPDDSTPEIGDDGVEWRVLTKPVAGSIV
jgi:hypothetical protein